MKPFFKQPLSAAAMIFAAALLAAPQPASAGGSSIFEIKRNEEGMPPLSEYEGIQPGLMIAPEESSKISDGLAEELAANKNSQTAMTRVEFNYDSCLEMYAEGKFKEIFPSLETLAAGGHRGAEELLGIMYRLGQGTEKNLDRAQKLLTSAANSDRPLAQHHLGIMYYTGETQEKNLVEALMWLQIASTLYPEGPEQKQAASDRDAVTTKLSRRERDTAISLARDWLQKRGMAHLMDMR